MAVLADIIQVRPGHGDREKGITTRKKNMLLTTESMYSTFDQLEVGEASFNNWSSRELGPTGVRKYKGYEEAPGFDMGCFLVPMKLGHYIRKVKKVSRKGKSGW